VGYWWNYTDRDKPKNLEEKTVPLPQRPPNIPRGMFWYRTGSVQVAGQKQITSMYKDSESEISDSAI